MQNHQHVMKKITLALFSVCTALAGYSQDEYTLQQCLHIALKQNFSLEIVRNSERIAANNYTLGYAGFLPTIDFNARYSGTLTDTKSDVTGGVTETNGVNNETYNAGVSLTWTLFNGFAVQTSYKRLGELQQQGELNTRINVENLVAQIAAGYYSYIQQGIRLQNLEYALAISRERLRIVNERYLLGSASRLDLQQARVDFNADSSSLIKQTDVLFGSAITLNELMALENVRATFKASEKGIETNQLLAEGELEQHMMQANASLLAAEKTKIISELDYKLVRSRIYPIVNFNTGYGYTYNLYSSATAFQQNMGLTYNVTLGLRLFDGFNERHLQKNARLDIANRELQKQNLELVFRADLAALYNTYRNNLALLAMESQNLLAARENLDIAIERYKLGSLSGFEMREAQTSFLDAEERLLNVKLQAKLSEISLMLLAGRVLEYL